MSKLVFESQPNFIQLRCSEPEPFYFARRRGKDSVGVLLYDLEKGFLVRMQPLVHQDDGDSKELFPCPITGSLEEGEDPRNSAIRECKEEAGYDLPDLHSLGSYIVGTQTDEIVYLFYADVSEVTPEVPTQDGTFHESISSNAWVSCDCMKELVSGECYSGLIIAYQRFLALLK